LRDREQANGGKGSSSVLRSAACGWFCEQFELEAIGRSGRDLWSAIVSCERLERRGPRLDGRREDGGSYRGSIGAGTSGGTNRGCSSRPRLQAIGRSGNDRGRCA